jgi:hypothetical protein
MRKFSLFIFDLAYFLFLLYNLQIIKTMCMWYHVINPRSDTCHLSPLVYLLPKTFKLFGIPIFFTKGVPDEGYYRNVPFTLLKISRIIFGIKFFFSGWAIHVKIIVSGLFHNWSIFSSFHRNKTSLKFSYQKDWADYERYDLTSHYSIDLWEPRENCGSFLSLL